MGLAFLRRHARKIAWAVAGGLWAPQARAQSEPGRPPLSDVPGTFVVDAQVGPTFLLNSESNALPHLVKPLVALALRYTWLSSVEFGGQVLALLDADRNYRVLGALAQARYALWVRPKFSLGASLGVGPGYDANILRDGLSGGGGLTLYGRLAADARWNVARDYLLGVQVGTTKAATAELALLAGLRL